ncbi:MAG: hypothetical protein E7183_06195 [Erysipelotrichaceae bacterium]|nr:hypothetical protein [Erysipelotrichaceae bacterium]
MKKRTKIFLGIVTFVIIFLLIINIVPPKKAVKDNPFLTDELPMVTAHRGGGVKYPESTMKTFRWCVYDLGVDILEFDLHLTKDNILVVNHDSSINRTTDVEVITGSSEKYYIKDHTIEELRQFNYGYNFEKDGVYPYRDIVGLNDENRSAILDNNGLSITALDILLSELHDYYPNQLFCIEIKDTGERGKQAADALYKTLSFYPNYIGRVVASSFDKEVGDYFKEKYPSLYRGASLNDAIGFIATQYLGVNLFYSNNFSCLQIPTSKYGIGLTGNTVIKRAHKRGIAVQYWTINDADDMRMLIEKGVDAIMTDDPELLIEILQEYK